jgi:hypothetical protein
MKLNKLFTLYAHKKFCEEYMALLRTETSGGAGLTRNFMTFLKCPDTLW